MPYIRQRSRSVLYGNNYAVGAGAGTPGLVTGTALGAGTFSEEPCCTGAFLFRRRCLVFFEKTRVSVLRKRFPTRRTAFVTRRKAPFDFRCFLERGLGAGAAFGTGAGAAFVAGAGAAFGSPPREKNFFTRRVTLRTPFLARLLARRSILDNFLSCAFILFTCVKNNHPEPYQRPTFYLAMPRPSWPSPPTSDPPFHENETLLLSRQLPRAGHMREPL